VVCLGYVRPTFLPVSLCRVFVEMLFTKVVTASWRSAMSEACS
jgi:hypothetical protein